MHNEAAIRTIQRRQLGLITVEQCARSGMSRKQVAYMAREGLWVRLLPGVLRDSVHPETADQLVLASTLWTMPEGVASHLAAGWAMRLDGVAIERPHIWVPSTRSARSSLVVVHRGEIEPIDRRMIGALPLTSPARTLIDLAGVLADEDLEAAVEDAIHRGLTTPQSIFRRLDALGGKGRPGSARLREILRDRGDQAAAASRLEVRIWRTLRSAGMRPVRQHRLQIGDRTYFVDCAFPQQRLAVEGVGDRYHRSPAQRRRDHRRLADLASVQWRVHPVTWREVTDAPDAVVASVMGALADAA